MDYQERRRKRDEFITNKGRNQCRFLDVVVPYRHEPCPTTCFGELLLSQYTLMRNLLKFLPCADLIRASHICREFMRAAEMELANRSLLCGSAWAGFGLVSAHSAFEKFADSIYCPTSLFLTFCTEDPLNFFLRANKQNFLLNTELEKMNKSLRTPMLTLVSDLGIVGTTSDLSVIQEGPLINDTVSAFSTSITIPKIQGLEVHTFSIKLIHARKVMTIDHLKRPDWLLKRIKGPNRPIRCILFFICEGIQIEPGVMFKALQRRQEEKLVIGGAHIPPYRDSNGTRNMFGMKGVAFYGGNVEASSLALTLAHKTPGEVDMRMAEFANGVKRGKSNICLMFTCCGRGLVTNLANERTFFDSEAFQKYFPTTPLHGIIGLGEIGCDWFPMENGIPQSKVADREWLRTFVQQQYSSVFVHLAFGIDTYEDQLVTAHEQALMVIRKRFGNQSDESTEQSEDTLPEPSGEAASLHVETGGLPLQEDMRKEEEG